VKDTVWKAIKWLLGCGLLATVIWLNWDDIVDKVRQVREEGFAWHLMLFSGLIYLIGLMITFYRWYLLVRVQNLPFRQVDAVRIGFVGFFFNNFLPGAISGDAIKAYFVFREHPDDRTVAIATIIVDRVIGLLGLIFLTGFVGIFYWQEAWDVETLRWILIFVWCVTAATILGWTAVALLPLPLPAIRERVRRIPGAGRILAPLVRCVELYRSHSRAVVVSMILAMIAHVGFVTSFYLCALSVGKEVPTWQAQFLLVPIGMVVQAVPLTPGGNLGVSEFVYKKLFEFKVGPDLAVAGLLACVAMRVVSWAVALIGLICYLPLRATIRKECFHTSPVESEQNEPSAAPVPHGAANRETPFGSQPADKSHEAVPQ